MSKCTVEQVETASQNDYLPIHVREMLCDYAALLRERESAKAAVTDEMVQLAIVTAEKRSNATRIGWDTMRGALEAVAPMLASAPISDEKLLDGCLIAMQTAQYQQASAPYETLLGELLATIHRDGGHYMRSHGVFKATSDAIEKIVEMLASARVPDSIEDAPCYWSIGGGVKQSTEEAYCCGWNACRNVMLTAAPKPETEE